MHLLDGPNTNPPGNITAGNPHTSRPASEMTAEFLRAVQDELANVITGAGWTLDKANNGQLLQAINSLAGFSSQARAAIGQAVFPSPYSAIAPSLGTRQVQSWGQNQEWFAGLATEGPIQGTNSGGSGPGATDNTSEANEYDTCPNPGSLYPYQVCASQMVLNAGGKCPAAYWKQGRNHYASGFMLGPSMLMNGARLEFLWEGDYLATESNRTLEFVVEPDTIVADAAAGLTSKAVGFQSDTLASSPQAAANVWQACIGITPLAYTLSSPDLVSFVVDFFFRMGRTSADVNHVMSHGMRLVTINLGDVDFVKRPQLWGARFKTTDAGTTIGAVGASDTSNQGLNTSLVRCRTFRTLYYPSVW